MEVSYISFKNYPKFNLEAKSNQAYEFRKLYPYTYIYIYMVDGVWVQLLGDHVALARVVLVLRECIWNAPVVSRALSAFDDTGSLGSPRQMGYPPG